MYMKIMKTITREQARQFILSKQGLLGNHRFVGKDGAYHFVCQAGCIQYDPVDVCGKNAELTLQSRVKGFTKEMLTELLYRDRLLVDYADRGGGGGGGRGVPYFSGYRERSRAMGKSFDGVAELEEKALAYIRENGPVSSDTLPVEGEIFWHSSMHWSGNWHKKSPAARSVLEQMYTDGLLVIHHKKGSRKYYDLAEKHLNPEFLGSENPCSGEEELIRWRVLRRIGAVGLLWNKNSTAFLGIPLNAEIRKKAFSDLEQNGKICSVLVDGINAPFSYRAEDDPMMQAVLDGTADQKPRLEFIAPLDPLLWDKNMIAALWDFQYSWEIYTPAAKRKYGYYTLPVLWGDKFIGRIEAAADRKSKTLIVKNIWLEPEVHPVQKLHSAISRSVKRLAGFNGCNRIEGWDV